MPPPPPRERGAAASSSQAASSAQGVARSTALPSGRELLEQELREALTAAPELAVANATRAMSSNESSASSTAAGGACGPELAAAGGDASQQPPQAAGCADSNANDAAEGDGAQSCGYASEC